VPLRALSIRAPLIASALGWALVASACGDDGHPGGLAPAPEAGGSSARGGTSSGGGAPASGGEPGPDTGGSAPGAGATPDSGAGGEPGPAGGSPGTGGSGEEGGGGAAQGGSLGTAGEEPTGGFGGEDTSLECPPEPTSGAPPEPDWVCDPETAWGPGDPLPIPSSGNDLLMSITPDGLSVVWLGVDVFFDTLYLADRDSPDEDFGDPVPLDDEMLAAADSLALSPDGLRLAAALDGLLGELTRTARGEAFADPQEGSFSLLDEDALAQELLLSNPVIGADDRILVYSATGPDVEYNIRVSMRAGDEPWPVGAPIEECELRATGGDVRTPTGISADGLALFYFDGPRGISRVAFRPALDWPFLNFVDLPDRLGIQPDATCDQLYYSGMGDLPVELLVSEPE
jgi:hypothetical protein